MAQGQFPCYMETTWQFRNQWTNEKTQDNLLRQSAAECLRNVSKTFTA